ncbi:MAG: methionyl-tRNA formyltransferase [Candidatus Omnitrophota bacterium]
MTKDLKIIFFGSSTFAVKVLEALLGAGFNVNCVVSQADKKAGRHLKLQATPVKVFAENKGLEVLCPQDLKDSLFLEKLASISPDIFIVVSYGKILPRSLLSLPRFFAINIHASLLPKYRGAAPIARAIMNGESITGITIIRMDEKMDEGDIISQAKIAIDMADNALTLESKLSKLACQQILEVLNSLRNNKISFSKQDSSGASIAEKLTRQDALIDWKKDASSIYNQIRGVLPWPVAFTYFKGKRIKIFSAKIAPYEISQNAKPGEIISLKEGLIFVATLKGVLSLEILQPENAKRISASEFISGYHLQTGDFFTS